MQVACHLVISITKHVPAYHDEKGNAMTRPAPGYLKNCTSPSANQRLQLYLETIRKPMQSLEHTAYWVPIRCPKTKSCLVQSLFVLAVVKDRGLRPKKWLRPRWGARQKQIAQCEAGKSTAALDIEPGHPGWEHERDTSMLWQGVCCLWLLVLDSQEQVGWARWAMLPVRAELETMPVLSHPKCPCLWSQLAPCRLQSECQTARTQHTWQTAYW